MGGAAAAGGGWRVTGHADSLLSTAPAELALTLPDEVFHDSEASGDHTAARLFSHKPDTYRSVVELTGHGVGALRVARMLGVSVHTVLAVRRREAAAIDDQRRDLADRMRDLAGVAVEAVGEALADPKRRDRMCARDAAITAAVLCDKSEQLSGQATIRIEVEHRGAGEELGALLLEARRRMDLETETRAAKGAGVVDLEPGSIEVGPALADACNNIHDVVSNDVTPCAATPLCADACGDAFERRPDAAGEDPAGDKGRGGGGRDREGGGSS